MTLLAVWLSVAVLVAVADYRKPHSASFGRREHLANAVTGGAIWPLWFVLMAVVLVARLRRRLAA